MNAPAKKSRPLSPHLQIYRPQISATMSIFHRMTGIALAAALPVFVAWLVVLADSKPSYVRFMELFHNPVGQVLLMGWTWAFFYHLCCGIRHLIWDAGLFLSIKGLYATGYIAFGTSLLLTALVYLKAFGYLP